MVMMILFSLIQRSVLWLCALVLLTSCDQLQSQKNIAAGLLDSNKKTLVFVTHSGPSTYYLDGNNQPAGFEYDLAKLFAAQYMPDYQIKFYLVNSISEVIPALLKGDAQIAAANLSVTPIRKKLVQFMPPYQEIQQQLIFNNEINQKPDSISALSNKVIRVPAGTSFAERLHALQQLQLKQNKPNFNWYSAKKTNTEALLEDVANGVLDHTVADSHLVALMHNYYPNLEVGLNLGGTEEMAWALSKNANPELVQNLKTFFTEIKQDGRLRNLTDRYYGSSKRLNNLDINTFLNRVNSLLPKYARLFKEAQEITGIDWRLLAAVSYRESHWDTFNTSPTNVRGLMMLTESTADLMGVTDRLDPKQSIPAGAKYIQKLRDTIPDKVPEPDRTYMALASYNIGYAHLEDARVLAQRQQLDPNSWADVKKTLVQLNNPDYHTTVKYGYASGGAPVIFVESIRSYYQILQRYQPSHQPSFSNFKIAQLR
jgi:membrane-bound lytic murein transglycosylase F